MKKRKSMKKAILAFAATLFMAVGVGGIVSYNYDAHAQDEVAVEKTGFYVLDGAAVRLKHEYDNFGIRFTANVGEKVEGATYNILIVPQILVDMYEQDVNENKEDIITYLEEYAQSKGGKLSIVRDCQVSDEGEIKGAIVNVMWQNLNREFVGVAYYEKDGKNVVAQYADDGARSVVEVSQAALDSGVYTSAADLRALMEKVRYGQMSADGVAKENASENNAYQQVQFCDKGSTVGVGTTGEETISFQNAQVVDNALQISATQETQGYTTINFGTLTAGSYRVQIGCELLNESTFSATVSQGTTTLSNVWDMKEVGENLYEFYFKQAVEGAVSFKISSNTTDNGTIAIDKINLSPVQQETLEYSRDKYMFGIGGLAKGINNSEGNWCDSKVTSEWMSLAVNSLGVESQRVWMSVPHVIKRADNSNELSINKDLATQFHNHFSRLKTAGVKRIMVMLSRFVYPYDYEHCSTNCAPDPTDEATVYKTWLEMQYQAFKLIAKEFPEIELWECGNEYDLDTFLYKNGLKKPESWGILESARHYTFTNTEKAYITADICYLASKAFKLYNPDAQIILPGMSKYAADKSNDHISLLDPNKKFYFEELYNHIESGKLPTLETVKVTNPDEYFDIIAYHCYADSVSSFETYNDTLIATAAAHGDSDKRIWITELGFTEEAFGGKGTEEAQSAIATLAGDLLTSLEQDKYKDLIESVFFFRVSDTEGLTASNIKESCYGMFHSPEATEKANQAKPLAVTLYNYFNGATATVDEVTFWKGSTTSEDFENVLFGDNILMNVGPNIALWNVTGELVDYNGGKALKVSYDGKTNAYNSITISFGTIEAGNYKVSLKYKVLDGRYSGAMLADSDSSEFSYVSATTALGNDKYCFYFNQAEKGDKKFTLSAQQWTMSGTILIDDIALEKVDEIPTDTEFGKIEKEDFENVEYVNGQTSNIGGVYVSPRKLMTELVDGADGKALKITKVESGYSYVMLSLGDIQAGSYTLSLDIDNDNFEGILQFFTLKNTNGYVKHATVVDNFHNYATLFKLSGKKGNTYTFTFHVTQAYEDFVIALVDSNHAAGVSMTIDNVKFEKTRVFDFETSLGSVLTYSTESSIELMPMISRTSNEMSHEIVKEENGNTYYKVKFIGWSGFAKIHLGAINAGNYLVSVDVNTLSGTAQGGFIYNNGDGKETAIEPIFVNGNTYTFSIVLDNDCANFFIGYKAISAGLNATPFVLGFDNITIENGGVASQDFGTLTAGSYLFAVTMDIDEGVNGKFLLDIDGTQTEITPFMQEGNIYLFKATIADGNVSMKYKYTATTNATVTLRAGVYKLLTGDTTVKTITSENFDNIALDNPDVLDFGGVYYTNGKYQPALVADENGGKKLELTKTSAGYGVTGISLGTLSAGRYALTMDVETTGGYPAILQVLKVTKTDGIANLTVLREVNKSLFALATNNGNTYSLEFTTTGDYNVVIGIATNTQNANETITLDNIRLETVNETPLQTIDFENVSIVKNQNNGASLLFGGEVGVNVSAPGDANAENKFTGHDLATEEGNTTYNVRYYNGWGCWSAFHLGYFKAGAYVITMEAKLVEGTLNGYFIKREGTTLTALTENVDYYKLGDTYVFKFAFAEDVASFGIGYRANNTNTDFTLAFDNITVRYGAWALEDVGTLTAGNYVITATANMSANATDGNFFLNVDGAKTVIKPFAKDGDTYLFKTTLAGDGKVGIGYQYDTEVGDNYVVELSGVAYKALTGDNTLKTATNVIFDDISFENAENADLGGVYLTNGLSAELVADTNGGKALKVTKNTAGYQVVFLSLGNLTAGNYTLTLDVPETQNFNATLQLFTLTKADGVVGHTCTIDNISNWSKLFNGANKVGNTYTLTFSTNKSYENCAIGFACSLETTGGTITIDNIKLEKASTLRTIDFENSVVGRLHDAAVGVALGNVSVNVTGTLTSSLVTEEGNSSYHVNFKGWGSWARVNLGSLKAGTYTVTLDAKLVSGTMQGNFIYNNGDGKHTVITPASIDGDTYSFKVTLEQDCDNFFIGYASITGQNADFTLAFDNIHVTVGTNADSGTSDKYDDWLDNIINKNN